jgi:ethanolamine utilization cobalamin adenosyltransferase
VICVDQTRHDEKDELKRNETRQNESKRETRRDEAKRETRRDGTRRVETRPDQMTHLAAKKDHYLITYVTTVSRRKKECRGGKKNV